MVSIDNNDDQLAQPECNQEHTEDQAQLLNKMISELPDNQQLAFSLHHMDGLSYEEMAEVMNTSISAVESLMFRAKKNLKNKVALLNERNEKVQFG